jgi:DNA-3-methyladenine glycosylase
VKATRLPGRLVKRAFFEDTPEHVAPRLLGKLLVRRTRGGVMAGRIVEVEAYLGPHHGTPDRAAHSYRGPTPRTAVLFGPAGHAYIYEIYGMHFCMNISCETEGHGGGLLLRALEPVLGMDLMARNRGLKVDGVRGRGVIGSLPPIAHPLSRTRNGWGTGSCTGTGDERSAGGGRAAGQASAAARALASLTGGPGRLCQALEITRAALNGVDLLNARSALQVREDGFRVEQAMVSARIGIRHAADLPLRFSVPGNASVSGPKSFTGKCVPVR